jgi:hypothetical protein
MRRRAWPALIAAVALACAPAAKPTASPKIVSLQMIVVPGSGGMADVTYFADGTVRGGHLSGDPQRPWVHQDEGRADSTVVRHLWAAARAIPDSLLSSTATPKPEWHGYVEILVAWDSTRRIVAWPFEAEHPDARVHALADSMRAHRIGGW